LRDGEATLLSARLKPGTSLKDVKLSVPEGLVIETPPIRIPSRNEVSWRLRATRAGDHKLILDVRENSLEKRLVVDGDPRSLAPVKSASLLEKLLYPAESPISSDSPFLEVRMRYPMRDLGLFQGGELSVGLVFLVVSLAAGFALKGLFRVQL
jgi:hypothetical protein